MDVSTIRNLYSDTPVSYNNKVKHAQNFDSVLDSAMTLLKDTDSLQKKAQKEEIAFALGESENTHDLLIAESKANVALQYTVAIRDRVIESYNTIMQMQI